MSVEAPPSAPWEWESFGTGSDVVVTDQVPGEALGEKALRVTKGSFKSNYALAYYPLPDEVYKSLSLEADLYLDGDADVEYWLGVDLDGEFFPVYLFFYDSYYDAFTIAYWDWLKQKIDYIECDAPTPGTGPELNTWFTLSVLLNSAKSTSDTYINGYECAKNVPFVNNRDADDNRLNYLDFFMTLVRPGQTPGHTTYIDNITVIKNP